MKLFATLLTHFWTCVTRILIFPFPPVEIKKKRKFNWETTNNKRFNWETTGQTCSRCLVFGAPSHLGMVQRQGWSYHLQLFLELKAPTVRIYVYIYVWIQVTLRKLHLEGKREKKEEKKKNDLYREIEHTLGELSLSMVRALIPYNREERSVC